MNKMFLGLVALLLIGGGCAGIDPNADVFVVQTERVTQQCVATLDSFLRYEADHREKLNPAVTKAADDIRVNAPPLIRSIRLLTRTYKATRLPEDQAALQSRVAKLEAYSQIASGLMEDQP